MLSPATPEEVWQIIDGSVPPPAPCEVALAQAAGCKAAGDLRALGDQPRFTLSAVDGYAVSEIPSLPCAVSGTVSAGDPIPPRIVPGTALRVFTGAPLPENALAVAKQEDCSGSPLLTLPATLQPGENIRCRGEVFRAGDLLLASGTRISPGAIGLLASAGICRVPVFPVPPATHIVTGSELVPAGQAEGDGKIPDANGPMIRSLLEAFSVAVTSYATGDDASALRSLVATCTTPLLLISGGAGHGEKDHTRQALEAEGFEILVQGVTTRPGKPLLVARRDGCIAFGLPGNPLSHWVCFHVFVARALARAAGRPPVHLETHLLETPRASAASARSWVPSRLVSTSEGPRVRLFPAAHSGDLRPLVEADTVATDLAERTASVLVA